MSVTMTVQGDDPILLAMNKLASAANKRELMDTIASYGVAATQERFIKKQSPDGTPWKEAGRGGQTLRKTARLFQSITGKATDASAQWGTNVIYAAIHQFGGVIKPVKAKSLAFMGLRGMVFVNQVKIPARPYLGINAEDRSEIVSLIHDWMRRPFNA